MDPNITREEGTQVGKRGHFESGLILEYNIVDHFLGTLPEQENEPIPIDDVEPPNPDEVMELMGLSDVEALLLEQSKMNVIVMNGTDVESDLSSVQLRC